MQRRDRVADPREQLLAKLNAAREERLDTNPDSTRYVELTAQIDEMLEKLADAPH